MIGYFFCIFLQCTIYIYNNFEILSVLEGFFRINPLDKSIMIKISQNFFCIEYISKVFYKIMSYEIEKSMFNSFYSNHPGRQIQAISF